MLDFVADVERREVGAQPVDRVVDCLPATAINLACGGAAAAGFGAAVGAGVLVLVETGATPHRAGRVATK